MRKKKGKVVQSRQRSDREGKLVNENNTCGSIRKKRNFGGECFFCHDVCSVNGREHAVFLLVSTEMDGRGCSADFCTLFSAHKKLLVHSMHADKYCPSFNLIPVDQRSSAQLS